MNIKTRLHKFIWDNPDLRQNYTRPEIMRNIENYGVLIDGKLIKKRLEWVLFGQTVELNNWPKRETAPLEKIKILKETENYLIVFKPFGVPVQPGSGHDKDNLLTWLLENFSEQKEIIKNAPSDSNAKTVAGLVHRLDKNTHGIILVARSLAWHEKLQNAFRNREVEKFYLAKIKGKMDEKIDISGWQTRDKREPLRQKFFLNETEAKNYDSEARNSRSIFTPLFYSKKLNQTLVKIQIKTGRMHQIRVTSEFLGFPLTSDHIYNQQKSVDLKTLKFEKVGLKEISENDFKNRIKEIFGDYEFNLLANEIEIKSLKIKEKLVDL